MRILYIVKEKTDLDYLLKMYDKSQAKMTGELTLLLIHDAVLIGQDPINNFKVFACSDDVKARGINTPFDTLDYKQMLKLIADCDKAICW